MANDSPEVMIARIDERTAIMWVQTIEIVKHLELINGAISADQTRIALLEEAKRQDRKVLYGIITGILAIIGVIITSFFKRIGIG